MTILNYTEAVEYIYNIPKFTTKNKPEHTAEFLNRLGHPERSMKIIHVAGTNGKGSVCAFLSSMLTEAGKRTALFTSPHLVKINERFQINNQMVSDEEFLSAFLKVDEVVKGMQADGLPHPTYFELLFGVAMVLFLTLFVLLILVDCFQDRALCDENGLCSAVRLWVPMLKIPNTHCKTRDVYKRQA